MKRIFLTLSLAGILAGILACQPGTTNRCYAQSGNVEGVELLLRLFDVIASTNPGYEDTLTLLAQLSPEERENRLSALEDRNRKNPTIAALTDSLLSSETYRLYYRQFRNVTPDDHRRFLMALPYRGVPGPADIGSTFLELFEHRHELTSLPATVSRADLGRAVAMARSWCPPTGDSTPPPVFYFLDGNGDAFAREGVVGFDLYGTVLAKRMAAERYENLTAMTPEYIETILAHEFQHIFAGPFLYPSTRRFETWQDQLEDVMIRRLVSEGTAMQCDPPAGFKKAVMEDSVVISHWLREVERVIGQIRRNETSEDSVRSWLDRTYHELASELLADYVRRTYPEDKREEMTHLLQSKRPDLVHTLGWWMVSHIAGTCTGPADADRQARAVGLLSDPHELFNLYNAAVEEGWRRTSL